RIWERVWKGLLAAGREQEQEITSQEPARRFLALLSSAISSGLAHIADAAGGKPEQPAAWGWQERGSGQFTEWQPCGRCVGWLGGEDLYLDPESAYAAAQQLGEAPGERLAVTQRPLPKRLAEQQYLVSREKGKLTNRRKILDRERSVLHLRAGDLYPEKSGGIGGSGGAPARTPEKPPNSTPDSEGPPRKAGGKNGGFPEEIQAPPPEPPKPPICAEEMGQEAQEGQDGFGASRPGSAGEGRAQRIARAKGCLAEENGEELEPGAWG